MFPLAFVTLTLFEGQDVSKHVKLDAPGVEYRMNQASATRAPWIHSNGWKIDRNPAGKYYAEVPEGRAVLAMAEANAHNADLVLKIDPKDTEAYGKMAAFLKSIERPNLKPLANFVVQEDGSDMAGEALNLMSRRNLLFRIGAQPGRGETPLKLTSDGVKDPYEFAQELRGKIGDDKRLLRIYGSEVVLANLTGSGSNVRVHLINYGRRPIEGLRVRLLGNYKVEKVAAFEAPDAKAEDFLQEAGTTEFSVSKLPTYAVIDLVAK
jgi:hypothetical protein